MTMFVVFNTLFLLFPALSAENQISLVGGFGAATGDLT